MRRNLVSVVLPVVFVIAIAGLLSACSATPSGAPSAAGSQPVAPPTLKLVTPAEGATVPAGSVSVLVEATGLKFVMPSNTVVPGEGHVHFTLDDQPFKMSATPEYVLKNVAPGAHTLKAELVQNDTKPFDPPAEQVITFTAR
jgi:hypothetical protein